MSKEIPLTNGHVAIVDDEDYPYISRFRWRVHQAGRTRYAVMGVTGIDGQTSRSFYMHRFIIDCADGKEVNFLDHNTLNLQKKNLILVIRKQATHLMRGHKVATSIYKGVYWTKRDKKWRAQIVCNGKHYWIGSFTDEKEAALAYNQKARELYGELSYQNEVDDGL